MGWIVITYLVTIVFAICLAPNETTLTIGTMFMFLGVLVYSLLNYLLILIKEFVLKEDLRLYKQIMDSFEDEEAEEIKAD